ncbi:hypothetical protein E2C01_014673 [Portunus trituberculatus]|uniref:Uncharacterized protein n=1 Tax=Portunus trituberculatus TaxID=210409 RepID=A0A5B7DJG6_PORTR|nr:hypothetical protein [Portunus trituberculatus]
MYQPCRSMMRTMKPMMSASVNAQREAVWGVHLSRLVWIVTYSADAGAYSLDEASLCYGLIGLQHILHHPSHSKYLLKNYQE